MGSTGTGHLSDYSDYSKAVTGVTGGKDTVYICDRAVTTSLEDVASSEYFNKYGSLPLREDLVIITAKKRIVAMDKNGFVIGNLPTQYNYLLECIQEGYQYEGSVTESYLSPLPSVSIAVTPKKV